MAVKAASLWAPAWGTGVGQSGQKWSTAYIAAGPTIFQKGAASVTNWQQAVASPAAANAFVDGLNNVNFAQVQTTVQGAGMTKYTSSGSTKQSKFSAFATIFQPKLSQIVSNLDQSNPRQPRGNPANVVRLTAYIAAVAGTRGQN